MSRGQDAFHPDPYRPPRKRRVMRWVAVAALLAGVAAGVSVFLVRRNAQPETRVRKLLAEVRQSYRSRPVAGWLRRLGLFRGSRGRGSYEIREDLAALGSEAVPALCDALRDRDPQVRSDVASALGEIEDDRAIGPLIEALADSDSSVRSSAQSALHGFPHVRSTPLLVSALKHDKLD
ncbi:MAG TPA: HEAT repeat domain-containing protein, partial [Phycisphaerae bacterium]|nr:HEAT repeat domain-containing protein [Phycisphaerae bacterium]